MKPIPPYASTADWPRKVSTALLDIDRRVVAGGVTAAWGGITGTLSAQTDLQSALNAKLSASAVSAYGLTLIDDVDAAAARATLGLGTLATQSGTFSGTSSGTNTGDQTTITGNAGTATALQTGRTISITGKATAAGGIFDGTGNLALNITAVTLAAGDIPTIAQSQVTNLTTDLAAKAPLESPTFTGTVTLPVSTATSLAAGGASIGTDKLAVTGTTTLNGKLTIVSGSGFQFRNGATDGFDITQLNTNSWGWTGLTGPMWFNLQNAHFNVVSGNIGIRTAAGDTPSALLEFGLAGSTTTAPIKLKAAGAALLTTPQAGVIETDGTDLYWTNSAGVRKKITIA